MAGATSTACSEVPLFHVPCGGAGVGRDAVAAEGHRAGNPCKIAHEARRIYLQAGVSHATPPANLSYIEPPEREAIVRRFLGAGMGSGVEG